MNATFELVQPQPHGKTRVSRVSAERAAELLAGYTREPADALARMRANPYGLLRCEGGTLRWNPSPENEKR